LTSAHEQYKKVRDHFRKGVKETCEFIADVYVEQDSYGNIINILWYMNQRGSNNLEGYDIIVNVGTFVVNIDALPKLYEQYYRKPPKTIATIESGSHGGYYHRVDSTFENFRTMFEEDEMYHAQCRGRPHLHPVYILVYGLVDERLRTDPFLHYKESYYGKRGGKMNEKEEWLLEYVKAHGNHVPEKVARSDMAKKFGINLDTAYRVIRSIAKEYDNFRLVWVGEMMLEYVEPEL
jgi:hypothetical protein